MATILDALGTMRETYLRKKAEHPETLTPGERARSDVYARPRC